MSTRRRRKTHPLAIAAAVLVGLVLALAVLHLLGWILATAAIAAGAYVAGRRSRQEVSARVADVRPLRRAADRRGRGTWRPPVRSKVLSAECAGGECIHCFDARCEHGCAHPARRGDARPPAAALPTSPPF